MEPPGSKQEPKVEQFFSFNPDSVGPLLTTAIDTLRERQALRPFVKAFITKHGMPRWNIHSAFYSGGRPVILVPVPDTIEPKVNGIIYISVTGVNQPVFRWIQRETAFKQKGLPDAKQLEALMLMYEKLLFGKVQTPNINVRVITRTQVNGNDTPRVGKDYWVLKPKHYCYQIDLGPLTQHSIKVSRDEEWECGYDYIWVLIEGGGGSSGGPPDDGDGPDGPGGGPGNGCTFGCGGPGDSNDPTAETPEGYDPHITVASSFENNPCLSTVYEKAGKQPAYDSYLRNFFGESSVADLYLSVGKTSGIALAETHPPTQWYIEIEFNIDKVGKYPALEMAGGLIHELIHAEMYRKLMTLAKDPSVPFPWSPSLIEKARNKFHDLWDYYATYDLNTYQHEQMADLYRNVIEKALRQFNDSFSDDVYEAFAWEGLMGSGKINPNTYLYTNSTDAWKNLSLQKRKSLVNKIFNFRANHPKCTG